MAPHFKPYKPGAASYAPRREDAAWEEYKPLLTELHNDNVSRTIMQQILAEQGFDVTMPQLHRKMARWNLVNKDRTHPGAPPNRDWKKDQYPPPHATKHADTMIDLKARPYRAKEPQVFNTVEVASVEETKENANNVTTTEGAPQDENTEDQLESRNSNQCMIVSTEPAPLEPDLCCCAYFCEEYLEPCFNPITPIFNSMTMSSLSSFKIQPACDKRYYLQHIIAVIGISDVAKPSQHTLNLIHSALEHLLSLLQKSPSNAVAALLAKCLAARFRRHLSECCHYPQLFRADSLLQELECMNLPVYEYDMKMNTQMDAFVREKCRRQPAQVLDMFVQCGAVLLRDLTYVAQLISQIRTCKTKRNHVHSYGETVECFEGLSISSVSLLISPLFISNLRYKAYSEEWLDDVTEEFLIATSGVFFQAVSLVFAKSLLQEMTQVSCDTDKFFLLGNKLKLCMIKTFGFEGFEVDLRRPRRLPKPPSSSIDLLISALGGYNDSSIFYNLASLLNEPIEREWLSTLDQNIGDFEDRNLQSQNVESVSNQDLSPTSSSAAAREGDAFSMLTCSSKNSFETFCALAHRLKLNNSKMSLGSTRSQWSGHMSVESWELEIAMGMKPDTIASTIIAV